MNSFIRVTTSNFDEEKFPIPPPRVERSAVECVHTPAPEGYLQWHEWARRASKTHSQVRCPVCLCWSIWLPKREAARIRRQDAREAALVLREYRKHYEAEKAKRASAGEIQ